MDELKPLLQIIHISDLHIVCPGNNAWPGLRKLLRRTGRLPNPLRALHEKLRDGTAPHDYLAEDKFVNFVKAITLQDQVWKNHATWLVDTGDLTTFGDSGSIVYGQEFFRKLTGCCQAASQLYGNHDAWPNTLPCLARNDIDSHRRELRKSYFPTILPAPPLAIMSPDKQLAIQLFNLNSVLHDWRENTLALGEIQEDYYWQHGRTAPTPDAQIIELKKLIDTTPCEAKHQLRVVTTHHPVFFPPPRPSASMVMKNDADIAYKLSGPAGKKSPPLAHLILSGHTHGTYPDKGLLPPSTRNISQYPLSDDQIQLVVGTLFQHRYGKSNSQDFNSVNPHQCQILRFFYSPKRPQEVLMDRLLAARKGGVAGDYGFIPVRKGIYEETVSFLLS